MSELVLQLAEERAEEEYHEKRFAEKIKSISREAKINLIHAKMPWDFEDDIGHLQVAISYLKEAALKSEWVDDGSGIEYTQEQYLKADKQRAI
jgi:hypothetical protein